MITTFPGGAANVPIVGQPKVHGWQISMAITCTCGKVLLGAGLPGQILAICTDCQVGYAVAAIMAAAGQPVQMQMQRVAIAPAQGQPTLGDEDAGGAGMRLGDEDAAPPRNGSTIVTGAE